MRRHRAPRASALAALLAAAVLALAGCGEDSASDTESEAEALGAEKGGSVASGVQCSDWVQGTGDEKLATVADIRGQLNRQDSAVDAPALSDDEALEVFDNACAESFASSFKLYVIYARAAAYAPLTRSLDAE